MTESRVRVSIVGVVALALFSALFARLWYLQVAANSEYAAAAQENRVRVVPEPPIRGRIVDAKGRALVDNRVTNVITVDRKLTGKRREIVVERLAELLKTPKADLQKKLEDPRVSPYSPVPVATDVAFPVLAYVSEHRADFPGVKAEPIAVRNYRYNSLAAHVLGYVGEINGDELAAQPKSAHYLLGDEIGKAGVEKTFESDLRGTPGSERLEIDSQGRVLRSIGHTRPKPGRDVQLTLDLDVQHAAEDALAQGIAGAQAVQDKSFKTGFKKFAAPGGAVVVLDAEDGSVVALASNPTYNPNDFVDGIPTPVWQQYNDPAFHYPLLDRAISGQYAPGSTFKPFTAVGAMKSGSITPETTIKDTGCYEWKADERCFWNDGHHAYGNVSLARALTVSSDVFFYKIGGELWPAQKRNELGANVLQENARTFGFGAPTNIALPNEATGRVPDAAWKQRIHDERPDAFPYPDWLPGDNILFTVGQGDVLVTPLQLASGYAAIATDGDLREPRIVSKVMDPTGEHRARILKPMDPKEVGPVPGRDTILAGLQGAVEDPEGTAFGAFAGFPFDRLTVAGKTGTAQVEGKQNTSVFVAVTPVSSPKYVVAVVIEEAGYGASVAAPVARHVIEALAGLPTGPVQVAAPSDGN